MARLLQLTMGLGLAYLVAAAGAERPKGSAPPRLQWWPPMGRSGPVATGRRWNHGPEAREVFPACHVDPFDASGNATSGCKVTHGGVINSWRALSVQGRGSGQDEDGWRTVFGVDDPAGTAAEKAEREQAKAREAEINEKSKKEEEEKGEGEGGAGQALSDEEQAKVQAEADAEELSAVLRSLGEEVLSPRLPNGGEFSLGLVFVGLGLGRDVSHCRAACRVVHRVEWRVKSESKLSLTPPPPHTHTHPCCSGSRQTPLSCAYPPALGSAPGATAHH